MLVNDKIRRNKINDKYLFDNLYIILSLNIKYNRPIIKIQIAIDNIKYEISANVIVGILVTNHIDVTGISDILLIKICDRSRDDTNIAKIKQKILIVFMNFNIVTGFSSELQYNLRNNCIKINIMIRMHNEVNDTDMTKAISTISN